MKPTCKELSHIILALFLLMIWLSRLRFRNPRAWEPHRGEKLAQRCSASSRKPLPYSRDVTYVGSDESVCLRTLATPTLVSKWAKHGTSFPLSPTNSTVLRASSALMPRTWVARCVSPVALVLSLNVACTCTLERVVNAPSPRNSAMSNATRCSGTDAYSATSHATSLTLPPESSASAISGTATVTFVTSARSLSVCSLRSARVAFLYLRKSRSRRFQRCSLRVAIAW
jgi:hypothetical protein